MFSCKGDGMKATVTIALVLIGIATSVSVYRYGTARAATTTTITSASSEICSKVTNKLECNADAAMIQNSYSACTKACPAKTDWYGYCTKSGTACEDDCELLNVDGKSAAQVKTCKDQCAKKEAECKANYRDKAQCTSDCEQTRQQSMTDFAQRWAK